MKELAAAGRRGRTVPTTSRSGLARMLAMRYVTERSISPDAVLYVITPIAAGEYSPTRRDEMGIRHAGASHLALWSA